MTDSGTNDTSVAKARPAEYPGVGPPNERDSSLSSVVCPSRGVGDEYGMQHDLEIAC